MNKSISFFAILTALSACGGSKTSNVQPIEIKSFAEVEAEVDGFYETYGDDIDDGNFNAAEDLPVSGSADYQGVIGIGPTAVADGSIDPYNAGQLSVNVEFDSGDVNGIADNFYSLATGNESDAEGTLSASIDDEGMMIGTFTGQFNGDTDEEDSPFEIDIQAGFLGDDAAAFAGSGTGTITIEGDELGAGVVFGAEQQ